MEVQIHTTSGVAVVVVLPLVLLVVMATIINLLPEATQAVTNMIRMDMAVSAKSIWKN